MNISATFPIVDVYELVNEFAFILLEKCDKFNALARVLILSHLYHKVNAQFSYRLIKNKKKCNWMTYIIEAEVLDILFRRHWPSSAFYISDIITLMNDI